MHARTITLYTRQGCHLCQDAEALLRRLGCSVTSVDVDADEALAARYGHEVPVLLLDGYPVLSGIIREGDVLAAFAASAKH